MTTYFKLQNKEQNKKLTQLVHLTNPPLSQEDLEEDPNGKVLHTAEYLKTTLSVTWNWQGNR